MTNVTTGMNYTSTEGEHSKWQSISVIYGTVMFFVLTIGFLGNVISIIILRYRVHRKKIITPLMLNLAVSDILITVLVYPVMFLTHMLGQPLQAGSLRCMWSSFANGASGMTSIATLVAMSGIMYHVLKQPLRRPYIKPRNMNFLVAATWLSGILANLPPLIGWSRAVPGKAGFSCAPEWTTSDPWAISYIIFLVCFGFFTPLFMIGNYHYLIYRLIGDTRVPLEGSLNYIMRVSRQKSQMKLVRMTAISIAAFLISWLPYTAVSIAALIRGRHVLTSGEAEIPELMAKASVIYNPFVYMFMNGAYRASFWELFSGNKEVRTNLHPTTNSAEGRVSSENSGTVNKSYEETAL